MLLLIMVAITLGYSVWILNWVRAWWIDRSIPTLSGVLPIIGHCHKVVGDSSQIWKFMKESSIEANEKGGIAKAWMGPMPFYMISDPEIALKISNVCVQKHYMYKFTSSWIGESLLAAHEPTWRRHRKLLNPTFNQVILDGFQEVFNRQSEYLVERFSVHAGKEPFDHLNYLADNALETVCKTVFGINETNGKVDSQYRDAVARMFGLLVNRLMKVWMHSDLIYKATSAKKQEDETVKVLKAMSSSVIQQKKAIFKNRSIQNNDDTEKGRKFKTFLDLLLELGEDGTLTEQEIREEVDGMIIAAHDTSSYAMLYLLIVLGSYPEVQMKVYEEIMSVFGDTERDVMKEDQSKLVYTEAVIKETLRFYTFGPMFARCANEDIKIDDKRVIPSGCAIVISMYGIHRHPCWGEDVNSFRPERWFEATAPKHPGAFAAFGLGRRGCIGRSYAMMSLKTSLAFLLRRYSITADHTRMKLKFDVMVIPESGHFIRIEKRKKM